MLTGSNGLVETQIREWVRKHVCLVDKENGRCKKIVLRHLNIDNKPQSDVHSAAIPGDPSVQGTEIADKVILDIAEAAQRDANDYGHGIQKYAIYAFYTANSNFAPRKIFRVAADDEVERDSEMSEPPTEKGLTAQLMRHNEINTKNSLVAMGYILQTFQKEISQQREQNRIFLQQQVDMTILVQDVMNESSKRRIEEKQAEIQVSMLEGVFEHLKIGLPILFNRLAGKEVFAPKMDRELYTLASILETMSPEQQHQLMGMLKPEQLAMLAELLHMYEERKHKFLKKSGDPDDDGGHGNNGSNGSAAPAQVPALNGKTNSAFSPGKNRLLALFEKRGSLANAGTAVEIEDGFTRRIEERALQIKNRLKEVKDKIGEDK